MALSATTATKTMQHILILTSSVDGQTSKINRRIAAHLEAQGFTTNQQPLTAATQIGSQYSAVLIGASIRYGRHRALVGEFIQRHRLQLDKLYCAFFSVNVVARKQGKDSAETNPYTKKLFQKLNWQPQLGNVFAGAINYPDYNFFDKWIIRFIMYLGKGPTDIKQRYEFTNWQRVDQFAAEFAAKLTTAAANK